MRGLAYPPIYQPSTAHIVYALTTRHCSPQCLNGSPPRNQCWAAATTHHQRNPQPEHVASP